jgi:tRNA(fMet)-specific endonuclease VapC
MYVLDTNTLIYFFKGAGRVADHLLRVPPSQIGIPSIVLYELETGIAKSSDTEKRRIQLDEMIRIVRILPFDTKAAITAATIRATLEKSGTPIGPLDNLIAGTTASIGGILVTHNLDEFQRIEGLATVDWFTA